MESEASEAEVKWIVSSAGPDWFLLRETVMGTPGLWYFRRRRQVRQKTLLNGGLVVLRWWVVWVGKYRAPPCPSSCFTANSICSLVTSGGNIAAPGPSRTARSWRRSQLGLVVESVF